MTTIAAVSPSSRSAVRPTPRVLSAKSPERAMEDAMPRPGALREEPSRRAARSVAPWARRWRIHAPPPTAYPRTGRSISTTNGAARTTSTTSRYRIGASGSEVTEAAVDNPGPDDESDEDSGDQRQREDVH